MATLSKQIKAQIDEAIKLYQDRKIERFDTARSVINNLSSRRLQKQEKDWNS